MKRFLIRIAILSTLVGSIHLAAAYLADGRIDPYYARLTTPQQSSLILGTSRAAQGILPEVINAELKDSGFELPVYNFAFTNLHSPYGPTYLKAIKAKLNPKTSNGIFILSVDPWSLSVKNKEEGEELWREKDLVLSNINCYTCSPNFDYLFRFYDKIWGRIIWDRLISKEMLLRKDGWLEVTVPMDAKSVQKRTREKIGQYQNTELPTAHFSTKRLQYLSAIIDLLKPHGSIYLVRIPVIDEILSIENELAPDFDKQMQDLAVAKDISYFSFLDRADSMIFTDGNHLYKEAGRQLSKMIVDKIKIQSEKLFFERY